MNFPKGKSVLHTPLDTPNQKARYIRQANAEGLKLDRWVLKHLDAVCDTADQAKEREQLPPENEM